MRESKTQISLGVRPVRSKYILCTEPVHDKTDIHVHVMICTCSKGSGPEVIKLYPCSTQLSTQLNLLINNKMPTIVCILTFISRIYTTSERFKARHSFFCRYFSFLAVDISCSVELCMKKSFITLVPDQHSHSIIVRYELSMYIKPRQNDMSSYQRIRTV